MNAVLSRHRGAIAVVALVILLTSASVVAPARAAARRQLSAAKLAGAEVPSLCGYPPGRLVQGVLPDTQPGYVRLATVRIGAVDRTRGRDAAAVMQCSRGGPDWPEVVLLYTATRSGEPRYRGAVDLGTLTKFGRETVTHIRMSHRRVEVNWIAGDQRYDPACCGTKPARAVIRLKKHHPQVTSLHTYGAQDVAKAFANAVSDKRWRAVARLATPRSDVVSRAQGYESRFSGGQRYVRSCNREFDDPTAICWTEGDVMLQLAWTGKRWLVDNVTSDN